MINTIDIIEWKYIQSQDMTSKLDISLDEEDFIVHVVLIYGIIFWSCVINFIYSSIAVYVMEMFKLFRSSM